MPTVPDHHPRRDKLIHFSTATSPFSRILLLERSIQGFVKTMSSVVLSDAYVASLLLVATVDVNQTEHGFNTRRQLNMLLIANKSHEHDS